jgi:hypothetical protein
MPRAIRGRAERAAESLYRGHFGSGTMRMYGFGDFQPCG